MAIEIIVPAWLRDATGSMSGSSSEFLLAPEDWFVYAALGMVLLSMGLLAWSTGCRRPGPAGGGTKAQSDLYRDVFHAMPYPMFCKDAHGGYLAVNRAYEDAFGIEAHCLLGRDLSQTRHLDLDCDRMHAAHLRIIRAAAPVIDDLLLSDARHGVRSFRLLLTPLGKRADGAALLGTVVAADGSHDAVPARRDAIDAALDCALLSAISHDVRTPLTGIIGLLELLGYSELTAHQRSLVDAAEQASHTLHGILDDVLALARLETGAMPREHHPFDLRGLLAGLPEQHPAEPPIVLALDDRLARTFIGDGSGLLQAVDKLLAHWRSRRPGTPPQLEVRVLAQGAQRQSIELVLAAPHPMAATASADDPHLGDELAWISACKLCEWIGFSLQEQGGSEPRFVMCGSMTVVGQDTTGSIGQNDPDELAGLAREDARRVVRRLADVFGDGASAFADYLQLIRHEEERLLTNLDGRDIGRLREVAHYLCGMGSFFGAQRLSGMAVAIELAQEAEEVLKHAEVLRSYLSDFIGALHMSTGAAAEMPKNTTLFSDKSHGNVSGTALEL